MVTKGMKIYSADGKEHGIATGSTRQCTMEGCRGTRIYVKWNDGKITQPCSRGLENYKDGMKIMS